MSIEPSSLSIRLVCECSLELLSSSYYACESRITTSAPYSTTTSSVQRRYVAYDSKLAIRQLLALFGSVTSSLDKCEQYCEIKLSYYIDG